MTVYVVDDEPLLRSVMSRVARTLGVVVREFASADAALAAVRASPEDVRLIVSDVSMPGALDGIDLAREAGRCRPDVPVVLVSSSPESLERGAALANVRCVVAKPFTIVELRSALTLALRAQPGQAAQASPAAVAGSAVATQSTVEAAVTQRPAVPGHHVPGPRLLDPWPAILAIGREAIASGHGHVGSEHVAMAALAGPDGFEAIALRTGVDRARLRPALEGCCTEPRVPLLQKAAMTPRVAAIVVVAAELAFAEGAETIGPHHLVGGLLLHRDCVAWRGLASVGLGPDLVARQLSFASPLVPPSSLARIANARASHEAAALPGTRRPS